MSKKLSKNGEKLKNLRKEPSESKKEKIKQRREDKKKGELIPKLAIQPKDIRPDADLIAPDEDLKKYQTRMKWIHNDHQMELNPVKSLFGRLHPAQVTKINAMINGGLLFNFLIVDFSSRNGKQKYITIGDILSLSGLLQKEQTGIFMKGPNRLLLRDLWDHRTKMCHSLANFMFVSKFWHSQIDPFIKKFNKINYIAITRTVFYNQQKRKYQCTSCQNTIADSDARLYHVMNSLRNDKNYYSKCAECAGLKIYRDDGHVPADNYAACSRCKCIFYIAFDYNGYSARCPECR